MPRGSGLAWWTPVGALAVVLALIVVVGRLLRARGNAGDASLPRDVLEVVGSAYLDPKQTLYVVRWGPRLLLVGLGSGGARTLAEVADPAEVERMVELCRQPRPRSVMSAFRKVLGVSPGRGEQ